MTYTSNRRLRRRDVPDIKVLYLRGVWTTIIAESYGVAVEAIEEIIDGTRYGNVVTKHDEAVKRVREMSKCPMTLEEFLEPAPSPPKPRRKADARH